MDLVQPKLFTKKWGNKPIVKNKPILDFSNFLAIGACDSKYISNTLCENLISKNSNLWDIFHNPFSIQHGLDRIMGSQEWEKYTYSYLKDGNFIFKDPWRNNISVKSIYEISKINNKFSNTVLTEIKNATIILLNFSLSEVWFHTNHPEIILNRVPIEVFNFQEECFEFESRISEPEEIAASIIKSIESLKKLNKNIKILLSVSPIPLKYTLSERPIIESNMVSKANLILGVNKIISKNFKNVYYFPYYEYYYQINRSNKLTQADGRHLNPLAYKLICENLLLTFSNTKANLTSCKIKKVNDDGTIIGYL
jgi:hypothetical protein